MSAILPPLFLQVTLTLLVTVGLAGFRVIPTLRDRKLAAEAKTGRKDMFSPRSKLFADNLQNQFELPVLFYVAVLLAIQTGPISDGFVTLAWTFVILRIIHALIHVTVNIVLLRFFAFLLSFITLVVMWFQLYGKLLAS
jgi:hypothetical protein